jgi:hypothetical protein
LVSLFDEAIAAELVAEPTEAPEGAEAEEIIEEQIVEEESVSEESMVEDNIVSLFDEAMAAELVAEPTETPEVAEVEEVIEEHAVEEIPVTEEITDEENLTPISVFDEVMTAEFIVEPTATPETSETEKIIEEIIEEPAIESVTIVQEAVTTEPVFELTPTPDEESLLENEVISSEELYEIEAPTATQETLNQEEAPQLQLVAEELIQPTPPPTATVEKEPFIGESKPEVAIAESCQQLMGKIKALLLSALTACWTITKIFWRWMQTDIGNSSLGKTQEMDTSAPEATPQTNTPKSTVAPEADSAKPEATQKTDIAESATTKSNNRGKNKRDSKKRENKNKKNKEGKKTRRTRKPRKKKE